MTEDKKLKKYILTISIFLFLFSLTQKAYCTTSSCGDSVMVFLLGWAALIAGFPGIIWMANPLLFACWWLLKRNLKVSMFLSMCSTLLSLSFLMCDSIADNEGGVHHQVVSYKAGYWLWVSSSVCMLLGTFYLMLRYNTRNRIKQSDSQNQERYLH
ncbi:MAG: hypothetical protein QM737_18960 [Ferruginibacter sp.]